MDRKVYFSIVSHNQTDLIIKNFRNFPKNAWGYSVVLVIMDNTGSERLKQFCEEESLLYYHDGIQRGFGANHNHIFKWIKPSQNDKFVVCNPDIYIERDQLEKMIRNSGECDIYSPVVYFDKENEEIDNPDKHFPGLLNFVVSFATQKRLHYGTRVQTTQPGWISGAFMLFKPSVYKALDGFDEDYFMYCEDIDICYRAQKMGYEITVDHECYIEHHAQMDSRNILSKNNLWHIKSAFKYALKHKKLHVLNIVKAKRWHKDGLRQEDYMAS